MALTFRQLGWGELNTAAGAVETNLLTNYSTPSTPYTKMLLVNNIVFVNTGTVDATLDVYVRRGSASQKYNVAPTPTALPVGMQIVLDTELTLYLNDAMNYEIVYAKLTAAPTGTKVSWSVNGIERDV
jgi:hypothetical protein